MLLCSASDVDRSSLPIREQLADHLHALRGRALRLAQCRSDADDLLSDTVERALRFEQSFTPGTKLRAWLYRIMLSVFITRQRSRARERRALDGLYHDPCAWPKADNTAEMSALSPPVDHAVHELPEKFSAVLWLVDVHELSYREAAETLDVPVGTVMSRLSRGRRRLASVLQSHDVTVPPTMGRDHKRRSAHRDSASPSWAEKGRREAA